MASQEVEQKQSKEPKSEELYLFYALRKSLTECFDVEPLDQLYVRVACASADSKFTQQELPAFKPLLTPVWVRICAAAGKCCSPYVNWYHYREFHAGHCCVVWDSPGVHPHRCCLSGSLSQGQLCPLALVMPSLRSTSEAHRKASFRLWRFLQDMMTFASMANQMRKRMQHCYRSVSIPAMLLFASQHVRDSMASCLQTTGLGTSCNVTMTVPRHMKPPIYVYYQLNNFYQNHRRYSTCSAGSSAACL